MSRSIRGTWPCTQDWANSRPVIPQGTEFVKLSKRPANVVCLTKK